MAKRAVLYARVSSDDRGKEGRNLKGQLDMCREHAQGKGYQVIAELAEDDRGASGASYDLEQLNRALAMARANEFDILVTRELDRLARGRIKCEVTEQLFKDDGVSVEFVLYDYPDTPEGRLYKQIRASIAEYERELIMARTLRARYNKVKSGSVLVHGLDNAPYGYRVIELENKRRMFEVYEPEARIVRLVFDWCINGDGDGPMGLGAIAGKLTDLGIPTSKGKHKWGLTSIGRMLKNTAYYGKWQYGKTSTEREPVSVAVPPIVDKDTWQQAQEQRAQNRKHSSGQVVKHEYLLRRYLTCGHCQGAMLGHRYKRKEWYTRYYVCAAKSHPRTHSHTCDNRYYRVDVVDEVVWSKLAEWTTDRKKLEQEIEDYQAEKDAESEPLRRRLAIVEDLTRENKEQLGRALDLYLSGEFPKEMLTERKMRLEETAQKLEQERTRLEDALTAHTLTDDEIANIFELAGIIREAIAKGNRDFATRREVIEMLKPQVTLYVEDGQRMAWVSCAFGKGAVSLDNRDSSSHVGRGYSFVLSARLVLPSRVRRAA